MENIQERLQAARRKFGYTQKEFCHATGIPLGTLRAWEYNNASITENTAQRIAAAFAQVEVIVDTHWLLTGAGAFPKSIEEMNAEQPHQFKISTPLQEALAFKNASVNHETFIHDDLSLKPYFEKGDIFGGIRVSKNHWKNFIGQLVLVKTADQKVFCRKLFRTPNPHAFHLVALNPFVENAVICNNEILEVYKINWMRRLENETTLL